jgi:PAS domain S-box-containing protein
LTSDVEPGSRRPEAAAPNSVRTQLEHQLAAAQKLTHIGSWEWVVANGSLRWSDELYRIYGLEPQSREMSIEAFLALVLPADRERVQAAVGHALETGGRFAHRERILRPDGSVRHLDSVGEAVLDSTGHVLGLIGTCRDVTEERRRDETIQLYANIVENMQIALSVWRAAEPDRAEELTLVGSNPAHERASGIPVGSEVGKSLEHVFPALLNTEIPEALSMVARDGQVRELPTLRLETAAQGQRTFSAKAFPLPGRCVGLALEDVTVQSRSRQLQEAEQRVLEMVAAGESLESVLTALLIAVEKHTPPTLASILLLDAERTHMRHGAAPRLPPSYIQGIDGEPIGPAAGSCGTAAYLGRPVFVTDIATEPSWVRYRELALSHGLRACWSTPIRSSEGRVLGTFALYYREPRQPGPDELELIARATHVAGLAIERKELDEQLRALSGHIEAVREDERTSVAREIHDELGQSLTALKMDVAWLSRHADDEPSARATTRLRLDSMSVLIDGVIDQVRRISAELRPGVLDDLGLVAAIEWQASEFFKRYDVFVKVRSNVEDTRFERNVSTALFRILQEALTNVARHARARRVDVSLTRDQGTLRLVVQDDGVGISARAVSLPSSLGLLGIRERARRLGGSSEVSGSAQGTRLVVEVPLAGAAG